MDGGIDIRLVITLVGMLISVISAAAIVKQKLAAVIEQLQDLKGDYETRLRELDKRSDRAENMIDLNSQKQTVLSSILSPQMLEKNHRELESLSIRSKTNEERINHLESIHNNRHPYIPNPVAGKKG